MKLTVFPVNGNTLTLFFASLYNDGLSDNTDKTYLASIHYSQIAMGLDDPNMGGICHVWSMRSRNFESCQGETLAHAYQ